MRFDDCTLHLRTGGQLKMSGELPIKHGQITLLIGDNGSGKSLTLAATAAALGSPSLSIVREITGGINIDSLPRRHVSLVRQEPLNNFIGRTAADEFSTSLLNRGPRLSKSKDHLERLFSDLDIDVRFIETPINRLSSGQQQLLAMGVALCSNPSVLLLDEPLSRLDSHNSTIVLRAIERIKGHCPLVITAHDSSLYLNALTGVSDLVNVTKPSERNILLTRSDFQANVSVKISASEDRRRPIILGKGETCGIECPGSILVQTASGQLLVDGRQLSIRTGLNYLYGENGSGKTLLGKCIAGRIPMNSTFKWLKVSLSDLYGLLSGLSAKGSLTSVVPSKIGIELPPDARTSFVTARRRGQSIYISSEPDTLLRADSVIKQLKAFHGSVISREVLDVLEELEIKPDTACDQLSYGQKKMVCLLLVPDSVRLAVLDEPLSGVSEVNQKRLADYWEKYGWHEDRCTIITTNKVSDSILSSHLELATN